MLKLPKQYEFLIFVKNYFPILKYVLFFVYKLSVLNISKKSRIRYKKEQYNSTAPIFVILIIFQKDSR